MFQRWIIISPKLLKVFFSTSMVKSRVLTKATWHGTRACKRRSRKGFAESNLGGGNSFFLKFHPENWGNDPI